jgi:hypothetical protein
LVGGATKVEPPSLKDILAKLKTMTTANWESARKELVSQLEPAVPALPVSAESRVAIAV